MKYVLALTAALFATSAFAAERQVAVTGMGSVDVTPDNANISVSVVTDATDAKASMKANTAKMQKVMTLLKGTYNIDDADLCTHGFGVYPRYNDQKFEDRKIVGWETTNSLLITIKDTSKAGEVLASIGSIDKDSAIRVTNIRFVVSDKLRNSVMDKAREEAVLDAKARAALYVKTAGATLGDVIAIIEQGSHDPYYRTEGRALTSGGPSGDRAVPLSAGKAKVTVNVAMTFSIK